ncbi:hypothetical protein CAPTEDRAFT_198052 [Capitella teleta]|uniref:Sulfotransferase domain-containing protein n=1 Tax=Capitella teleta TaxID=283909 RepID=R7VKY7_CAPTE|nr:hypothetical protein CAPTEDRAFT_198052 [Capitella teleta]|eukprot:ELU17791.1 hypothetical protein CAPTEDRAFT_198052 [Capitella teleta]
MTDKGLIGIVVYSLLFGISRFLCMTFDDVKQWCKKVFTTSSNTNIGFENSARLDKVISINVFDRYVTPNQPSNIISRHMKYVHPCYVLKDEVSFYCLTKSEAWFVEAPEGVEVWKRSCNTFHKPAQHENAVNVIRMPLQSLYRLTNEMDDIKAKLFFIEYFPRCGSTLLLQMFEETGECVTYSEPHYFNHFGRPEYSDEDVRLAAVMKIHCKPRKQPTTAFVFKAVLFGKTLSPAVRRLYPQAKFLYLYRNIVPHVTSYHKLRKLIIIERLDAAIRSIHPRVFWMLQKLVMSKLELPYTEKELNIAGKSDYPHGISTYYNVLKTHWVYLQRQQQDADAKTPSIKYEDLIKDPSKYITAVFRHYGLPLSLVPKAMRAMHKDSQRGSVLARTELKKRAEDSRLITEDMLAIADELGSEMGFEDALREFRLPYDISDS